MTGLRDRFEAMVLDFIPGTRVNGTREHRVCNTTSIMFGGIDGRKLIRELDRAGVRCSQSSACTNFEIAPSYVLCAMGLTEEEALEQGLEIEVGKFPWMGIGRAVAAGETEGFIKVIRGKEFSEILGAHIVGAHATELIAEFVIGRHLESTVEELEKAMHPHPTLSEGVAEGALAALGRAIHV